MAVEVQHVHLGRALMIGLGGSEDFVHGYIGSGRTKAKSIKGWVVFFEPNDLHTTKRRGGVGSSGF